MCQECWAEYGSPKIVNDRTVGAVPLIDAVYKFSCVGGNLHIMVGDFNIDDEDLKWIREEAMPQNVHKANEKQLRAEWDCLKVFEAMTIEERASALAMHGGYFDAECGGEGGVMLRRFLTAIRDAIAGAGGVTCDGCAGSFPFLHDASGDTSLCDTCINSVMMFGKYPHELNREEHARLLTRIGGCGQDGHGGPPQPKIPRQPRRRHAMPRAVLSFAIRTFHAVNIVAAHLVLAGAVVYMVGCAAQATSTITPAKADVSDKTVSVTAPVKRRVRVTITAPGAPAPADEGEDK